MTTNDWIALGSMGTFLAFVVGFVALIREWWTRRQEHQEEQASKVSAWLDDRGIVVANGSGVPVYRLVVWTVLLEGAGPTRGEDIAARYKDQADMPLPPGLLVMPPGELVLNPERNGRPPEDTSMFRRPAIELAFTDSGGRHWIRRADGHLESSKTDAVRHYGIPMPGMW